MRNLKILFYHRWVGVHGGGTETHIKELVRLLQNHNISILTREGDVPLEKIFPKVKVWRVSKNPRESPHSYEDIRVYFHTFLFVIKSFLKLVSLWFKGKRFDVISVHFATEALVARIYRAFFKTPFVFVLEGYTELEGKTAKWANAQIAISKYEAKRYLEKFGFKAKIIPIGINRERFNLRVDGLPIRKKFCPRGEKFVLTVCRLEPRKDLPTLFQAAKIVHNFNPRVKFIIVGDGILREKLENKIEKLGIGEFVKLVGFVSDKDLPKYYAAADLFVLPTLEEGFGIVFLEAMASGCPILSTNVGAVLEVVEEAGVLIKPSDPKLLAEKIFKILENRELSLKLKEEGQKRIQRFSWQNLAKKYEEVYMSVAK